MGADFKSVIYLGIKEQKAQEIEFFIKSIEHEEILSCRTSIKNPTRKNFLDSLNVGVPIKIQADLEVQKEKSINVHAFII